MPNEDGSKTPEELMAERAEAAEKRFAAIENGMRLLAESAQNSQAALQSIVDKMDKIGQQQPHPSNNQDESPDLETMNRKDFAAYLMSQLRGALTEGMKPFQDTLGKLDEKIDAQSLSSMIKEFQKGNPDFFEWKDEMRNILKENPRLTPARAYALARAEADPTKLKQIDAKYGLGKPEKSNGETQLLSMFPSSSSSSATKGAGKMNPLEAAEAAWSSVMGSIGQTH